MNKEVIKNENSNKSKGSGELGGVHSKGANSENDKGALSAVEPMQNKGNKSTKSDGSNCSGFIAKNDHNSGKCTISIDIKTNLELSEVLNQCNKKDFGKKIKKSDVISCALRKLGEKNISEIQEMSFSLSDRIKLAHEEFNKKNKTSHSFEEFLAMKLKIQ